MGQHDDEGGMDVGLPRDASCSCQPAAAGVLAEAHAVGPGEERAFAVGAA